MENFEVSFHMTCFQRILDLPLQRSLPELITILTVITDDNILCTVCHGFSSMHLCHVIYNVFSSVLRYVLIVFNVVNINLNLALYKGYLLFIIFIKT